MHQQSQHLKRILKSEVFTQRAKASSCHVLTAECRHKMISSNDMQKLSELAASSHDDADQRRHSNEDARLRLPRPRIEAKHRPYPKIVGYGTFLLLTTCVITRPGHCPIGSSSIQISAKHIPHKPWLSQSTRFPKIVHTKLKNHHVSACIQSA